LADNRILECAVAAVSDVVPSGDKHLLVLDNFRGIDVVTVSDLSYRWPASGR
jgi:predicted nucleic acid-binding protein